MTRAPNASTCLPWLLCLFASACSPSSVPNDATSDALAGDATELPDADADACGAGPAPGYPPGPYSLTQPRAAVPDLRFAGEDGREVALSRFYAPCASPPRLLVVRVMAAWSGPSQWAAAHTQLLRELPEGARLDVLDLLVLGQDNLPATPRDLAAWRARYDAPPDALAIDPEYRFAERFLGGGRVLPLVVLIDARRMQIITDQAPSWDDLAYQVRRAFAVLDGADGPPPRPPRQLHDGRFTRDQWDMIRAMTPVPPPPPSPTNAHADDPRAASLGRALFADARLSPSGSVSCASCHRADLAFADGLPRGVGLAEVDRNTPSVLFAAHTRWQFWDGRADSLWAQALGPLESPAEMGSSRLYVAHAMARHYAAEYAAVFGPLPPLDDGARFPAAGRPGDPAWEAMAPADRDAVNRVFANVGKALEAFERTLRTGPTPLDRYAAGEVAALTERQRDGLRRWFEAGCIQCHHGPLLTDGSFHNITAPTGRLDGRPDPGRFDAIATLLASEFRADGPYSDAREAAEHLAGLAPVEAMRGQFRTPALRAVALTGPWGHGGTFRRLDDLMLHYAEASRRRMVTTSAGPEDPHLVDFHVVDGTIEELVGFHDALTPTPLLR